MRFHLPALPRLAALCGTLLTCGCTFGVVEQTGTRSATYGESGWKTLRVRADQMSRGLSVAGSSSSQCKVDATVAALMPDGSGQDAFGDAELSFHRSGSLLDIVAEARGDYAELLYFQGMSIRAPSGIDLDLVADGSDVAVQDMSGAVKVKCGSGRADLLTAGAVDVQSESGDIKAAAGTTLRARSSAGEIVASAGSVVDILTESGDATIDTPAGGKLVTDSGKLSLKFLGDQFGATELRSISGPLEVVLPKGSRYDLDVLSSTGDIHLEIGGVILDNVAYNKAVKGGGPLVKLTSDSGSITVLER